MRTDWVIAPGETLKEWLSDNRISVPVASACIGTKNRMEAREILQAVLDRKPYGEKECAVLSRVTSIPAVFWQNLEHNYRAGLEAGLKDVSSD